MILVDANLLIYAYDGSSASHEPARSWLEATFAGTEPIRLALISILAFVRLTTNPTLLNRPLPPDRAVAIVESWLSRPTVAVATPSDRHWRVLNDLARHGQARGSLLMDTHIAALAVEHGATLMTTDRGFARYPGLRFKNPIAV